MRGAYGNALALLNIEVHGQQPRVSLLPVDDPKVYRLPESKIENLCMDENSVRFHIRLVSDRNTSGSILAVDAYLPEGEAQPKVLLGSMAVWRSRFPVELERTELKVLDRGQASASAPGSEELRRFDQSKDSNKERADPRGDTGEARRSAARPHRRVVPGDRPGRRPTHPRSRSARRRTVRSGWPPVTARRWNWQPSIESLTISSRRRSCPTWPSTTPARPTPCWNPLTRSLSRRPF